ncbi:MAG: hypothetical protein Q9195_000762 [Heterodermia aff. obscurata]
MGTVYPLFQIKDHVFDKISSQPSLDSPSIDRGDDNSVQRLASLNLRALASGPSFNQRDSSIKGTSNFKRKPGSTKQESHKAPTVPPTYPWLKEKRLRPQAQHIPGSFGSILEPHAEQGSGLTSPARSELATTSPINIESARPQETYHLSSGTALESLHHVKGSGAISVRSKASLRDQGSEASLNSTASERTLMKPEAESSLSRQVVQPVVTREIEQVPSNHVISDTLPLSPKAANQPQTHIDVQRGLEQDSGVKRSLVLGPVNGTPISQLLSELPPIKQSTIDNLNATQNTLGRLGDTAQLDLRRQSIREHCRELDSNDEAAGLKLSGRSDLPLKSFQPADRLPEKRKGSGSTQSRSSPSTPLSIASRKAASLSRAITVLSQFSSRSNLGTLPLRSSTNYEKIGSGEDNNPTDAADNAAPSSQRSNWVQNLLGRSLTGDTSNLTTRPTGRRGGSAYRQQSLKAPANQPSHDENHRSRSATGATDEQASVRRQQDNAESFSRAISDLETLLREALIIAHQAASEDDRQALVHRKSSAKYVRSSDTGSSSSGGPDEEDNHTSIPPIRVDHGIMIVEPDDQDRYNGNFKKARDATPYTAGTRSGSMVPPLDGGGIAVPQSVGPSRPSVEQPSKVQATTDAPPSLTLRDDLLQPFESRDWAVPKRQPTMRLPQSDKVPSIPRRPTTLQAPLKEVRSFQVRPPKPEPPTQPAAPRLRFQPKQQKSMEAIEMKNMDSSSGDSEGYEYADFREPTTRYRTDTQMTMAGSNHAPDGKEIEVESPPRREDTLSPLPQFGVELQDPGVQKRGSIRKGRRSHFSIKEPQGFSLSRSHKRAPIARDWSTSRKRWTATIACVSTALLGIIVGIYAGEVPAIQYTIVDEHHYTILGNVVFFIGLAITTVLFFPLPLLHGRKPYTLAALAILLPLQFPQALVVNTQRSPSVATYRAGLLLSRAAAGLVMGLANINFLATLLDLFGSSLQSSNPHQELVDANDVRRHGGGMGMWLGIWTWCFIGSIGLGFLIGAVIISGLEVAWGFWITIILTAAVLVLNVLTPETRRSAYRRSLAEVRNGGEVSRRVARGEMKMHLDATGPIFWWEEVVAGWRICLRMLKQPGFVVLSLYLGWIYGQIVLIIVLLGALTSKYYHFHPQYVGLAVAAIPIGALLATPFQKASLFSRARTEKPRTDSMTVQRHVTRSSHFIRRAVFMILLPFAGLAYTLSSGGHHTNFMVPIMFAGAIGFLSNLAIAECNGIIMETYDTSDLQPGMTGRPRKALPEEIMRKRTNFSCFPRVTAAFAISQSLAFLIAAAGTGTGGAIERRLGAQTASAVVAGILLGLTLLLIAVLTRFKTVQIIPTQRYGTNILSGAEDEWKPVIIGHPSGNTRRMSFLELGKMTRWSEIRRRNRLATGLPEY